MFNQHKNVVCLKFSKNGILCALTQINGRKIDILATDQINLESGLMEDGIIYDIPHVQQIVKNLITSVSSNQNKVESAWIALPDNKISILKFEVEKDKKGINEYQLHQIVEHKTGYSGHKLHLINKPIHELNNKVFFLTNSIRTEHLLPYLEIFEPLDIEVESVFPTFGCIFEEIKNEIECPTLVLYPNKNNYKFFIADNNGVHMESVHGHNIIENNEFVDKAVQEIIEYAKQSKEVAIGVKKVLAIESKDIDSDSLQIHMRRAGIDFNWYPDRGNSVIDPVSLITLKGLIKNAMSLKLNKGFLEHQITHEESVHTPTQQTISTFQNNYSQFQTVKSLHSGNKQPFSNSYPYIATANKNTVFKSANSALEEKWNLKVILVTILLAATLIGTITYAGWMVARRVNENAQQVASIPPSPTSTVSPAPTSISTPTPTSEATAKPTPDATEQPTIGKKDIFVLVLNSNNITGQAAEMSARLRASGFQTRNPANSTQRGLPTTTVYYKNQGFKALADEAAKVIESSYPSAKSELDTSIQEDIVIILGAR
jgi:cell division septation protein DedD